MYIAFIEHPFLFNRNVALKVQFSNGSTYRNRDLPFHVTPKVKNSIYKTFKYLSSSKKRLKKTPFVLTPSN